MENFISRRSFLSSLGLTGAGLCIGVYAATKPTSEPVGKLDKKPDPGSEKEEDKSKALNPNVFIHISSAGLVTIVNHRSEMGQGIKSSLPVLLADELGARMSQVKILQAEGDKKYGDQNTDGSNSIRGIYEVMRQAAATARMMLTEAAAKRWKVSPSKCVAEDGLIKLKGTRRSFSFGELAIEAGKLEVPKTQDVKLRPLSELKNVGRDLPLLDGPDYVKGSAIFGADFKIPGMLYATIVRPPVVGGEVKKFNKDAALKVAGVKQIIEMPVPKAPYAFQPWGGVAVIAEHTWAALQGAEALDVQWNHGKNASYESVAYRKVLEASVKKTGLSLRRVGDAMKALEGASKTIEGHYYVPHLNHMPMEPLVALADFRDGKCECWAPTQNPQAARTEVARVLGTSEENVRINVTLIGGGFGRKSKADFISEAAFLSKKVGAPVRVQWNREQDFRNDYLNTVNFQTFKAGLDEKGKVIAWTHRTAFPPIASTFDDKANRPTAGDLQQGVLDVAFDVPNILAEACEADAHVRVGWLRSVYNIFHSFGVNSFIDEIAHAQKRDPREMMLEIYGPSTQLLEKELGVLDLKNYGQPIEKYPVDGARLEEVIKRVTKNANWDKRAGRALGLAAHRSFLSYVAVVASATKNKAGKIYIDEVWVAIDAGIVINTDRVRAQMEGSVINGLSHLFYGGVTHKDGAVMQSNFDETELLRMDRAPKKIHVEIVKSTFAPGGVGEPGVPPVSPAVANAIFALTGKRIREFNQAEVNA